MSNRTTREIDLFIVCMAAFFTLFCTGVSLAAAVDQPIEIEADKMTAMSKSDTVTFTGNVDARQGDLRIRADEMTIHYLKEGLETGQNRKDAQQVRKIVCNGNVEVTSKDWLGTSKSMQYFAKDNLLQLIGDAKAYKGQNMVEGERINYYLDTGRSEVLGAGATLSSDKNGTEKDKGGRVNMTIME